MKTKRTYNLSADVVERVKRLVETKHAAPTQDAFVEQAIQHYERHLQDLEDAELWTRARGDSEFHAEQEATWAEFEADDRTAFES